MLCQWVHSTFETLMSIGKPCSLSTVINVKSLKNSGNTSEKLRRKVTRNTIAVNEDIAEFHTVFPICPQSYQMLCLKRIMRPFPHEEIAFTATSSHSSGSLAAILLVCV